MRLLLNPFFENKPIEDCDCDGDNEKMFLLNRALFENKPTKLLKNMFAIVRIWVLRDCNLKSMFCVHAKIFHPSTKFGTKRREETISFFSHFSALFPSLTMVIMRSEHDSIHR